MREDAGALSLLHGLPSLTHLTAECMDCQLPRRAAWPLVLEQAVRIKRGHVGGALEHARPSARHGFICHCGEFDAYDGVDAMYYTLM